MKTGRILQTTLSCLILVFTGCQRDLNPIEPATQQVAPQAAMEKVTIRQGVTVESAILSVYQTGSSSGNTVTVHRITADWTESEVTWKNFQERYEATPAAEYTNGSGWHAVNITSLVQAWINGTQPSYGVVLRQPTGARSALCSSEWDVVSLRPKLEVTFNEDGVTKTVLIQRGTWGDVPDAYIWAKMVDYNGGSDKDIFAGKVDEFEKLALLRFDLRVEPYSGCTLTPGYWKTHSIHGPAREDTDWLNLGNVDGSAKAEGADESFYNSGQTYYQVLWTSPSRGNVYYILAHAFIAAKLNMLAGANADELIASTLADAESRFSDPLNTPGAVGQFRGTQRQSWLALARILDDYNNGRIGPGHCGNGDLVTIRPDDEVAVQP